MQILNQLMTHSIYLGFTSQILLLNQTALIDYVRGLLHSNIESPVESIDFAKEPNHQKEHLNISNLQYRTQCPAVFSFYHDRSLNIGLNLKYYS